LRILIDYRPAVRERTGVGEYVHEMARALARRPQTEVVAFSSSWKDRVARRALSPASVVDRRVPVHLLNFAWHRLSWPPVESLGAGRIDIAHAAHPLLLPSRTAARAVTIHDLDFLRHPERTVREIRRDYPRLARDHARRADLVVVSSSFAGRDVIETFDLDPNRVVVCPAGAPRWPRRTAMSHPGYLLFLGTLEPRKNIGGLLDAYERVLGRRRDAPELRLAGRATPAAAAWLDRLARPPLAGHVKHVGYVRADERRTLYEGARLLVLPSFEEGFGLPALEAMTVGVPVVASRRGALPELVGDAGLLVDPDPDELAAAIERVLDDDTQAARMADRGAAQAARFDWDRSAAILRDAYEAAIARRGGAA
jgi:glycosyltransferase involved in cell wall biosynthesis